MRISRLLVSAIFLLSFAGGEAIAKGAAKNGGPPKKGQQQQEQTQDKSKGGGGFAVKGGKSGKGGDNWEKDSKKKDPF